MKTSRILSVDRVLFGIMLGVTAWAMWGCQPATTVTWGEFSASDTSDKNQLAGLHVDVTKPDGTHIKVDLDSAAKDATAANAAMWNAIGTLVGKIPNVAVPGITGPATPTAPVMAPVAPVPPVIAPKPTTPNPTPSPPKPAGP